MAIARGARAKATALTKATASRSWAGFVAMPLLYLAGLGVLVALNFAHRSLWGQLIYAVTITTAVVWAFGRVICKRFDMPPISPQRSLLWAVFGLAAIPVAVAHRPWGLVFLLGLPMLWLAARATSTFLGFPRDTPPSWTGLLGGIAALALFVGLTPRVAAAVTPPRAAPVVTDEDQEDAALARVVRPVLLFDENEARFPVDLRTMIEDGQIETCRAAVGRDPCDTVKQESEFDLGADYVKVEDLRGQRGGGRASTYYYRVVADGDRVYVDYWWYFTRNPTPVGRGVFCTPGIALPGLTCHEHPSDWEGMTVVLGPCRAFGPPCLEWRARRWAPAAARYAQHESVVSYAWRPALVHLWRNVAGRAPLRPVAYVANNSHASYPSACRRSCKQYRRVLGTRISETPHDGRVPWNRNEECTTCLKRVPLTRDGEPALWNAFSGLWGKQDCILAGAYCDASAAPGSPSQQKRYRDPGRSGPWMCLRNPADPFSSALRRCTSADPDHVIPGAGQR